MSNDILKTRHKFKSFSQQIALINADVNTAFELSITTPGDSATATFFYAALLDTLQKNFDPSYTVFSREMLPLSRTLPLILHNKDKIFRLIIDYLKRPYNETKGGIENVLKLISHLSRDLRSDFYPYFHEIFTSLANLIVIEDPSFVSSFFQCLCFLLKFLQKWLVQDMDNVLSLFVTSYFNHPHEDVRRLSAQSLAYLLRQAPNKKRIHKHLLNIVKSFLEGKDEEESVRIIKTLGGYLFYHEIKNVSHSLWSNAPKLINPFLQVKEQFVFDSFLYLIDKVVKHVNRQKAQDYIQGLAQRLPSIDVILCFKVFIKLMEAQNHGLFENSNILLSILEENGQNCPPEILSQFLAVLDNFKVSEENHKIVSEAVIHLLNNSDINQVLETLKDAHRIATISSEGIIKYVDSHFNQILPNIKSIFDWINPNPAIIPDSLVIKSNKAFNKHRDVVVPLFYYLHNHETYELMKKLNNLTIVEHGALFSLMGEFDSDLLISQPPKFIEFLGDQIQTEEALKILRHLVNVCYRLQPEWLHSNSDVFQTIFNRISFNTPNCEIQKLGASVLSTFIKEEKPIELYTGDELIVQAANTIWNKYDKSNESLRRGESMIERLTNSIQKIKNFDKLVDVTLAFARHEYLRFREHTSNLIGSIIKFDPEKYGPMFVSELDKYYPWVNNINTNDHLFGNTLFRGIQCGHYVDQNLVDLISKFCHRDEQDNDSVNNKVLAIETLVASTRDSKYNDQVVEAGYALLRSIHEKIRKAAFSLVYTIVIVGNRKLNEPQREKIKTFLEIFINAENNSLLVKFNEFLEEFSFERLFIGKVAVYLSIGVAHEFLAEKRTKKKQYKQRAANLLQALAFLTKEEVSPLVESFLVETPTASDIRRFPKFFIPMISRIPHHLVDYLPQISHFLESALKQSSIGSREMNNSLNASALFFESPEFYGFEEFAENCLCVLDYALNSNDQPTIRLTTAIAGQFPSLFSKHPETVTKIIQKLKDVKICSSEIINIITKIITEVPDNHNDIIEAFKVILENSKFFKREQIWKAFLIFLSFMKESFATPEFIDLLVTFLVYYRHIETIPIAKGLELTPDQFSRVSTLIAYPLTMEFREELIPLIADYLGDYSEPFIKLNRDDISEKALTYRSLDSAGDFSFIFALQSFADLQLNDFSLRSAAVGFVSRVIQHTPKIVDEYILPAIQFHVKKQHSRIPPNEIYIILQTIIKTIPDILPSIRRLAEQPFFLSLGSFDADVRSEALSKLTEFINQYDDWNVEEIGKIFFPLLCQSSTTPGIEDTLSVLCHYATPSALSTLLRRLIRDIKHGSTIHLLVALCKAQAFPANEVGPALLDVITEDKKANKLQIRLIPALLSVDKSTSVIHKLIATIAPKLSNKKDETRKLGQQSLTQLILAMAQTDYFILFQDLRHYLDEGRKIPVLFLSLNNLLTNAQDAQGAFDDFIQLFAEVLLEDIFGYMGQMRAQKAAEIPEAKKCVSFNSFELLAKYVTFSTKTKDLIDTVLKKFNDLRTIEQSKGAKRLIQNLADGFVENETVDAKSLVDTVLELLNISDNIKKAELEKKKHDENYVPYGRKYEKDILYEKPVRDETEDGNEIAKRLGNNYLVSLMAVRLLYVFFERDLFDTEDAHQAELLSSLLTRLWDFIKKAQDTETLVVSLSILQHYIELPSFSKFLPDVVTFLTTTISRLKSAADVFGKAVFSLLTAVLTKYEDLEMPTPFTRALVSFCGGQLDVHDSCDSIFGVLKLVMDRRKDIPEIYDLVQPAIELCVRALSPQIRRHSALFVSQFMTTYQMSQPQFKKYIQLTLANLASQKATARRAFLTFFSHFIADSPDELLDPYSELILAHMGARVANESDERVIPKLRKVIGKLFMKVSGARFLSMWNLMVKWASTAGKQVRTGLLLLAISVEYCSEAMANLVEALQQIVDVHIESESNRVKIAATELHKQIVAAYPGNESTKLLKVDQVLALLGKRETTKVGCEILQWYYSEFDSYFQPTEEESIQIADSALDIVISWQGIIDEASEALYSSLVGLQDINDLNSFYEKNNEKIISQVSNQPKAVLSLMRVFVKVILDRQCDSNLFLKYVLILLNKAKEDPDSKTAAEKAIEVLRHNVEVNTFTEILTNIIEEEKERKKREEIERQVEEELNPEEYQKRIQMEREKAKEEERRKKYLVQGDQNGILYAYGIDGKKVESVPLAPEFR